MKTLYIVRHAKSSWEFDVIEAEIHPLGDYDDYDEAQDSFNDYKEQLV